MLGLTKLTFTYVFVDNDMHKVDRLTVSKCAILTIYLQRNYMSNLQIIPYDYWNYGIVILIKLYSVVM